MCLIWLLTEGITPSPSGAVTPVGFSWLGMSGSPLLHPGPPSSNAERMFRHWVAMEIVQHTYHVLVWANDDKYSVFPQNRQ